MIKGLHLDYDISKLAGAEYNPRFIDDSAIERLKASLQTIGCVKPIIARNKTIVAGHQRARALRSLGASTAPVFLLSSDASLYDEVRFNQLHNGTDLDLGDEAASVTLPLDASGYVVIQPEAIKGNLRSSGAPIRQQIMYLVTKYGLWGAAVCGEDGRIFHAAQYALACKTMNKPLLVYVVKKSVERQARECLSAQYGVFNYDKLPRDTYIQTFAQMLRLRDGPSGKQNKSPTYDVYAIPWLKANPGGRLLDFGCGQGDYAKRLKSQGYYVQELEFFRRAAGTQSIDVGEVNRMVDQVIKTIKAHGRYDAVICDYVLNSVDSQQAEDDVLNCLQGFCKPGGDIFFSGRSKERVESIAKTTKRVSAKRDIEFLDNNGLTALYRKGSWFYQKFHSKQDVERICDRRKLSVVKLGAEHSTGWQCHVKNTVRSIDAEVLGASLEREFNMKVSKSGRTLGRDQDIKEALLCLL
jgi:ParB family chromosome partitioning protein